VALGNRDTIGAMLKQLSLVLFVVGVVLVAAAPSRAASESSDHTQLACIKNGASCSGYGCCSHNCVQSRCVP
jgi:hypothetical protein